MKRHAAVVRPGARKRHRGPASVSALLVPVLFLGLSGCRNPEAVPGPPVPEDLSSSITSPADPTPDLEYWTPERMEKAEPAPMPVETGHGWWSR